jgi:sirohydrochlorin ferrochelatase
MSTESFEQGDEALDEESRINPDFTEQVEQDPSLDPTLLVDDLELEEAGAEFDDPEDLVTLEGGIDDPDGLGEPSTRARARRDDTAGWDLDALETGEGEPDADSID